jgi:hypothetical protein
MRFSADEAVRAAFLKRLSNAELVDKDGGWSSSQARHHHFQGARQPMVALGGRVVSGGLPVGSGHSGIYRQQDTLARHADYAHEHAASFLGHEEFMAQHLSHADEFGMTAAEGLSEMGAMAYQDWVGMHGGVQDVVAGGMFPGGDVGMGEAELKEFIAGGMSMEHLSQPLNMEHLSQPLNVHAAEFQARRPRVNSKDLGLPNDLIE